MVGSSLWSWQDGMNTKQKMGEPKIRSIEYKNETCGVVCFSSSSLARVSLHRNRGTRRAHRPVCLVWVFCTIWLSPQVGGRRPRAGWAEVPRLYDTPVVNAPRYISSNELSLTSSLCSLSLLLGYNHGGRSTPAYRPPRVGAVHRPACASSQDPIGAEAGEFCHWPGRHTRC